MGAVLGMASITPTQGSPAPIAATDTLAWQVVISADPGNSAEILIDDFSGHVLAAIVGGQSYTVPTGDGQVNLRKIQLDATASGQIAYVCYSD